MLNRSLFAILLASAHTVCAQCLAPQLITPAAHITPDARPTIRWAPVAGATSYWLKLQSRIPEGPVVASFDLALTEREFVPPGALTHERAKVSVEITARCAAGASPTTSAWFVIDATANCPAPTAVRWQRARGGSRVQWASAAGPILYEVRLHAPLNGNVLRAVETREPSAELDMVTHADTLLSVRSRCAQGFSDPVIAVAANG